MIDPKIKVKVIHSESKSAWNIIGDQVGKKFKIARVPYFELSDNEILNTKEKNEALQHAEFIAYCFNNSTQILDEFVHSQDRN